MVMGIKENRINNTVEILLDPGAILKSDVPTDPELRTVAEIVIEIILFLISSITPEKEMLKC